MSSRFLQKTRIVLTMLFVQQLCTAQGITLASRPVQRGAAQHEESRNQSKNLKDLLVDLGKQHQVSILFEEETVKNITITGADYRQDGGKLEKQLSDLLKPFNLRFKKAGKEAYVIVPRFEKKASEAGTATIESATIAPAEAPESSGRTDVAVSKITQTNASEEIIKGRVTDERGDGLPGVNVVIKGSQRGVTTDIAGKYELAGAGPDAVLIFSFVGYLPKEEIVGNRSVIDISLAIDTKALEEVVVIGYGTAKKKDLTGAVAVVGRKEFGDVSATSAQQLLQGKIAGVQIVNTGGLPGSNAKIIIRGVGSLTNSDPLYVIDGIQGGDINSVSPYDIQDITVLKDAASVAIYGASAANGVVLITTKKGKAGAPKVTYNGYVGVAQAWKKLDMLNAAQYVQLVKDIDATQGNKVPDKLNTPDVLVTRTDWQKEIFRNGKVTEHHVNVTGGSDKATYNFSAGYTNQEGIMRDYGYQRINLRTQLEEQIGKRIRLGQTINFKYTRTTGNAASFVEALRMPPYAPTMDPTNLGGYSKVTTIIDQNDALNPLPGIYLTEKLGRGVSSLFQLWGEVDIINGLKFRTQANIGLSNGNSYNYTGEYLNGNTKTDRKIEESYSFSVSPIIENILSYTRTLGRHDFSLMAGNTYNEGSRSRSVNLTGSGFTNDLIKQIGVSKSNSITGTGSSIYASRSYFGRLTYAFHDRYLVNASIRQDINPAFGKAYRKGNFPSVGVAWKVANEDFMKNISFISDLKLRGSWGITGNANIGLFLTDPTVYRGYGNNNIVYSFGENKAFQQGATVTRVPNLFLKWEETTQIDFGVDFGLLQNRLQVSLDYYKRDSKDLLLDVKLPVSTGLGDVYNDASMVQNAANAVNKGFEAALSYAGQAGDFSYSISANTGFNKNNVVSLGNGAPIVSGSTNGGINITKTDVGAAIGSFYGFQVDHVVSSDADVARYNEQAVAKGFKSYQDGLKAGDIVYKDLNNDGRITDADQSFLGSAIPVWTYGGSVNLSYKALDLSMGLAGIGDVKVYNALRYWTEGTTRPFNSSTAVLNAWKKDGDITDMPRSGQNTPSNLRASDRFLENGSFMRLRNLTLGFSVPKTVLNSTGGKVFSSFRIYATAMNLLTLTKYKGYDPEVSASVNDAKSFIFTKGVDTGQYPQPRTFLIGLQVGF
ncbi:TonB-dependent receptor [Dyadobacter chenwenxiniae]|uniref:TonB-dependent receptor n=1 Tax=Dyadobacter chenwenxiniae TaxID=2906456 RepID=A0A9X1PRA0_9BACT|nr:TonB-dependent receptor [Dyadobacter chenwenxiniae]MCF0064664.1 TonB-dependent receptor [Dyadobacter chenwenxiniae]UON84282.1 TonB-dependent receptor [Dyadobacter chenwenxiniae]